jgi:hypothetical protein
VEWLKVKVLNSRPSTSNKTKKLPFRCFYLNNEKWSLQQLLLYVKRDSMWLPGLALSLEFGVFICNMTSVVWWV